jgi:hypothetical protein
MVLGRAGFGCTRMWDPVIALLNLPWRGKVFFWFVMCKREIPRYADMNLVSEQILPS